jgi:hypothetical protein
VTTIGGVCRFAFGDGATTAVGGRTVLHVAVEKFLQAAGDLAPAADGAAAAELIISVKGFRAAAAVAGR